MEDDHGGEAVSSALDDQRVSGQDLFVYKCPFFSAFTSFFTCLCFPADKMYQFRYRTTDSIQCFFFLHGSFTSVTIHRMPLLKFLAIIYFVKAF